MMMRARTHDCVTPCIYGVSLSRPHAYGAGEIPSYRARDPRRASCVVRACVCVPYAVCASMHRWYDARAGDGRGAREADPGARARRGRGRARKTRKTEGERRRAQKCVAM